MAEVMYPVGYISHVVAMKYYWIIANWNYGQGNWHHGQTEWNTYVRYATEWLVQVETCSTACTFLQSVKDRWLHCCLQTFFVDHGCRNVWKTVLQYITRIHFQRWQFGNYVGNTTAIPIKMSQITNIVFSNCNQLSPMRGKDGWSDTWQQRSSHLNQFCIQLWPLKKGTEDFILIFQHDKSMLFTCNTVNLICEGIWPIKLFIC